MNFYPHHIGDYLTATAHLSWLEDCAYRRLLDIYYSREQSIPADIAKACRLVRAKSKDERTAVDTVLNEFFTLTDSGWSHTRCEEEIIKARVAAARSKANGMKGGRPAKKEPRDNPEETQQVISGFPNKTQNEPDPKAPITNPITNSSVPKGTDASGVKDKPEKTPEEMARAELWKTAVSVLENGGCPSAQTRTFMGKLVKDYTFPIVQAAVAAAVTEQPADAREYLKAACQTQAGQRTTPNKQVALEQRNRAVAEAWANEGEIIEA